MVEVAKVKTNSLTCPNRNKRGAWITLKPNGNGCRMGYYGLWSIPTKRKYGEPDSTWDLDRGNQPAPFFSPIRSTDYNRYSLLMADLIEKGTDNFDEDGATFQNITSVSHSPGGMRWTPSGQLVEPQVLGSEGGNIGHVDGSVIWRRQNSMKPRAVVWNETTGQPSAGFTGYW